MKPHAMTIREACSHYGCGRSKFYELISTKKIEAVKLGTKTLILVDSVERYFATLPRLNAA